MSFTKHCNEIFNRAIHDYHVNDDIDAPIQNPFEEGSIENRLYLKCRKEHLSGYQLLKAVGGKWFYKQMILV